MNNFSRLLTEWTESKKKEDMDKGEVKDSVMVRQKPPMPQKTGTIVKVDKKNGTYDVEYGRNKVEKNVPYNRIARITKYDAEEDAEFQSRITAARNKKRGIK